MPTPLEILLDPISLVVLAMYGGLMLWEAVFPGRKLPRIKGWRLYGLASFAVFFFLSSYLPLFWDGYLAELQLFDLTGLGTLGGVIIGLLVYELAAYAYHRAMHESDTLWRTLHQMHHSAERLDTYGAFYFSPLDMIGWTAVGSFALVLIVGVTPQAATILLLTITFLGIFQHANIRTPRWLGYLVQRPESHTVHPGGSATCCCSGTSRARRSCRPPGNRTWRKPPDQTLRSGPAGLRPIARQAPNS